MFLVAEYRGNDPAPFAYLKSDRGNVSRVFRREEATRFKTYASISVFLCDLDDTFFEFPEGVQYVCEQDSPRPFDRGFIYRSKAVKVLLLTAIALSMVTAPASAQLAPQQRTYGYGIDPFGGGITYGHPTYRIPRPRPGWATPWPLNIGEPLSPPEWNARWEGWQRPGYFGGEANYHGVFDRSW